MFKMVGNTPIRVVYGLFAFSPGAKIQIYVQNVSGTFHNSTMAGYRVYDTKEEFYNLYGVKVEVDSAFIIGLKKDYFEVYTTGSYGWAWCIVK